MFDEDEISELIQLDINRFNSTDYNYNLD
jgi:hypothetical protein